MATEEKSGVLVEHWPTILWRSAANWAAWLSATIPDILIWAGENWDIIPTGSLTEQQKMIARMVIVSIAVPLARSWKQEGLRKALAKKEAEAQAQNG